MIVTSLLLYMPSRQSTTIFYECLQYLVNSKLLDVVAGDFNIDGFLKVHLQDVLTIYSQIVQEPTHIGGFFLDHVYKKNTMMEEFFVNTYIFDHDAVGLRYHKGKVIFKLCNVFKISVLKNKI